MSASILNKDNNGFGSVKTTASRDAKSKPKLKKHLQFSPDIEIKHTDHQNKLKQPLHVPVQDDIIESAFTEFEQLRNALQVLFQINRDMLRKKATFTQNIAYRVLGSIDWTCADFEHIEKLFKPFIKKNSSDGGPVLSREYGKYVKLNEQEVKLGIHEWAVWRVKFNNQLISAHGEQAAVKQLPLSFQDSRTKDNVYLYMIAKWSNDNSNLDFGSYVHYGIPRARIRKNLSQSDILESYDHSIHTLKLNSANSTHSSGFLSASDISSNESSLTNVTVPSAKISASNIDSRATPAVATTTTTTTATSKKSEFKQPSSFLSRFTNLTNSSRTSAKLNRAKINDDDLKSGRSEQMTGFYNGKIKIKNDLK